MSFQSVQCIPSGSYHTGSGIYTTPACCRGGMWSDSGTPEGPHTPTAAGRCGIPNPSHARLSTDGMLNSCGCTGWVCTLLSSLPPFFHLRTSWEISATWHYTYAAQYRVASCDLLCSCAHVQDVLLLHPTRTCTNGCWCPVPLTFSNLCWWCFSVQQLERKLYQHLWWLPSATWPGGLFPSI